MNNSALQQLRPWSPGYAPIGWATYEDTKGQVYQLVPEQMSATGPWMGYSCDGSGWSMAIPMEMFGQVPQGIERWNGDSVRLVGGPPKEQCTNVTVLTSTDRWGRQDVSLCAGVPPVPWGTFWAHGPQGWAYLPVSGRGMCPWEWSYIPGRVLKNLPNTPPNWNVYRARHPVPRAAWWFYPLAIYCPQGVAIDMECQAQAMTNHTTTVVSQTKYAVTFTNKKSGRGRGRREGTAGKGLAKQAAKQAPRIPGTPDGPPSPARSDL